MLHGDGQYAPELLPHILLPLIEKKSRFVLGSRMLDKRSALAGGMPLYKWVVNQVLTFIENKMVATNLREFHTGFAYADGVAVDSSGNVYVADSGNSLIRKVTVSP